MPVADKTTIELAGNPFVDTGLAVIAALGNLDDVRDLTLDTIRAVHGDGSSLARWNAQLKSYSQVFGTNNPLFQSGYGYKKGSGPSRDNLAIYQATLQGFLDAIQMPLAGPRCEACGTSTTLDFARVCRNGVEASRRKAPEDKWIGRDWFPLCGSLGSDAQALPAASRSVRLCGRCLLAVHYLPLAVVLLNGRLAVFQSTSTEFWYELVRLLVNERLSRIGAGDCETLGAKEGARALAERLLALFERLQRSSCFRRLPNAATLQVWRFSNAGASPGCEIEEIPNPALVFLWNAVGQGLRQEIEKLIESEGKRQRPLFRCIAEQRDYPGLYPRGGRRGASPKLFALYQIEVCRRSSRSLSSALALANEATRGLKANEVRRLQREEAFSDRSTRSRFRGLMVHFAQQGVFALDHYLDLFPFADDEAGTAVRYDGWNVIRYYLHHGDSADPTTAHPISAPCAPVKAAVIRYYAAKIAGNYVRQYGMHRFKQEVLGRLGRGQIGASWLKRQFVTLAQVYPGFTFAMWERLCNSSNGRPTIGELLFQARLLWTQWMQESDIPGVLQPHFANGSGLPTVVENGLKEVFRQYTEQRGLPRLERDVLARLRNGEIGLLWFQRRLASENDDRISALVPLLRSDWDAFIFDHRDRAHTSERLFQMRLTLANLYRETSQIN